MLLVLLTTYLKDAKLGVCNYDTLEFFAGKGRLTTAFRLSGRRSAALDAVYDDVVKRKGSMNIMTDAGFV